MKSLLALLACAGCFSVHHVELVALPVAPPPGPWLTLRDAFDGCARAGGLAGELRIRIEIDPDGVPGSVASAYGDAFDACIGRAIQRSRYDAYRGREIDVPFTMR